jgi:hypothetical protein
MMNSRLSFGIAVCLGVLLFSQADADHHKKKNKDNGAELTQCTIQSSNGGMGCVAPLKLVCQKMKNGKKCCGCVPDKNAQAPATASGKCVGVDCGPAEKKGNTPPKCVGVDCGQ